MSWKKSASAQFQLSEAEVIPVVKKYNSRTGHDSAIFKKVQEALVELEIKVTR